MNENKNVKTTNVDYNNTGDGIGGCGIMALFLAVLFFFGIVYVACANS